MHPCVICGADAPVHDIDSDTWYCDLHCETEDVCSRPHEHIRTSDWTAGETTSEQTPS